jgi:toxin ParE1/3/4
MPIEISREAHEDIAGIYAWIAQDDAAAARKVAERLYDAMERLRTLPHLSRDGRAEGTRELVVSRLPYIIVFHEGAKRIVVEAVMHVARDR